MRGSTWTWYLFELDPVTGKRRQVSKGGFRTRREAQHALNEALARLRGRNLRAAVPPYPRQLPAERVAPGRPAAQRRPSTWLSYRMNAETHIVLALGHLPLQRLTPVQLTAVYRSLLDNGRRDGGGLAPKTVRNIHGELHTSLKDAMRWGYVARNVAASADLLKGMAPEVHVRSPEQLRAFLDHARWTGSTPPGSCSPPPACGAARLPAAGPTWTWRPAASLRAVPASSSTTRSISRSPRRPRAAVLWPSTRPRWRPSASTVPGRPTSVRPWGHDGTTPAWMPRPPALWPGSSWATRSKSRRVPLTRR
jgi:Arm DNA-binding domain